MPRIVGPGSRKYLPVVAVIVLFAFTPISRALLVSVDGSFAPKPYSSLALKNPSDVGALVFSGQRVSVRLTNHTGSTKTYFWRATQKGVFISLGEQRLQNGRGATIDVPTSGASSGSLRITLTGTDVFVTIPILKS
jgi:hypothetical protein